MSILILALLLAATAGSAMAFQGSLNTALGKVVGMLEATLIVHGVGLAVILPVVLTIRGGKGGLAALGEAPWYTFLGGAIGVFIVFSVVYSMRHTGVAKATTAIIIGQVVTAMLVDHYGLFGLERILTLSWHKGLGVALLAAGGYLLLR